MTSKPQFPPCGKGTAVLNSSGSQPPLKTWWRWILISLNCIFPLTSAHNFREFGDLHLQSKVSRFNIQGLGISKFSYNSKKKKKKPTIRTIIIPFIHRRFMVYKALSIPQTGREEETEAQTNYWVTCLRSLGQLVARPGSKHSSSDSGARFSTPELPPELPPLTKAA